MTRRRRIMFAAVAAIVALVLFLPLSAALPLVMPNQSGLTARAASGTIWSGTLHDARLSGVALGTTTVSLSPVALLAGEARLRFTAPTLNGALVASGSAVGIDEASGPIELGARVRPLPIARIVLDRTSIRFSDQGCARAAGPVRAEIAGEVGGIALPGGMTGTLRCDGRDLLMPLVGQSGMERLNLRVDGRGRWRADLTVRPADPATAARLLTAGFASGPGGLSLRITGAL